MWEYNYNYLSHHGVKGQKWGDRNYQYEDGSLTPEGRVHYGYGKGNKKSLKETVKNKFNKAKKSAKEAIQKHKDSEMSNRISSAMDVLKNGDTDWMGRPISDDDSVKELKNRGKAALERLLYNKDQIEDRKLKRMWQKDDEEWNKHVNEEKEKIDKIRQDDEEWVKRALQQR